MNFIKKTATRIGVDFCLLFMFLFDWIKKNTKKAIAGLAFILIVAGTFVLFRDVTARTEATKAAMFWVNTHIRNLPQGQHHSLAKAIEAAEMGIKLAPNQTIVDAYPKRR